MVNKDHLADIFILETKKYLQILGEGEMKYAASFFKYFNAEEPHVVGEIIESSLPGTRILALRHLAVFCEILN